MEIDRDLVSRLPEQVRAEAARYVAARDLDSLVKLLDEQPPDPVVLLCVAWARTRWASVVRPSNSSACSTSSLIAIACSHRPVTRSSTTTFAASPAPAEAAAKMSSPRRNRRRRPTRSATRPAGTRRAAKTTL